MKKQKPKNMPPYPNRETIVKETLRHKDRLITEMMHMEKAMSGEQSFHFFVPLTKARKELKEAYKQMEGWRFKKYR